MNAVQAAPSSLSAGIKSNSDNSAKPKPCCVCKDEKAARDECMLFANSDNAQKECQSLIDKYKSCMKGFGFDLP